MFSVQQKQKIADAVQRILRETGHHELPAGEISFCLHVDGAKSWSWADIRNNGAVVNPSNEAQDFGNRNTRRFASIIRQVDSRTGIHTIDAIDEDGRAWWHVQLNNESAPMEWVEMQSLPNREDRP